MGVSKNRDTPKWSGLQWKTLLKWRSWGKPSKLRLFFTSNLRWLVVWTNESEKMRSRQIGKIIFSQFFGVKVVQKCLMYAPFDWIERTLCKAMLVRTTFVVRSDVDPRLARPTLREKDTPNWWLDPQSPKELNKTWDRRMSDPKKVTKKL